MRDSFGSAVIIAAVILGLSVVTGSFLLKSSIDEGAARMNDVLGEIQSANARLAAAPAPSAPTPNRPSRGNRPDPNKNYEVAIGAAPKKGPDAAKIKIVEWSDFQCPFCGRAGPTLTQVEQEYGEDVQLVFKHMPLSMHSKAPGAHAAAEAASMQGKFWEMHDRIFANQRDLSEQTYEKYATEIGLDLDKFKADSKSPAVQKRISGDMAQASKLGVTGTPAFFINGRFLSGAQPFSSFKRVIDEELAKN